MKEKYQLSSWPISRKVWYIFLLILAMIGGWLWVGILIVPDWQFFINYPEYHQALIYLIIFGCIFLLIVLLRIIVDFIFSNQRLEDKIEELEAEAERLRKIQ